MKEDEDYCSEEEAVLIVHKVSKNLHDHLNEPYCMQL